jgi:hypothetical protein
MSRAEALATASLARASWIRAGVFSAAIALSIVPAIPSTALRAVVTDHDLARRILDALPTAARAPPSAESTVAYDAAFA